MDLGARAVLLKGGHLDGDESTDIVLQKGISGPRYFSCRRTHTRNDHGTGCALATSIAAGLAEGIDLPKAVSKARVRARRFASIRSLAERFGTRLDGSTEYLRFS
jgi:hydroxymethylpyrimidine/phosphomethylpyrimidine kinase